jgi:hypothetical protein
MKKLIAFLAIVFFATVAFSQGKPVKQDSKKVPAKTEAVKPAVKPGTPTKSDGTPDMRYKSNKEAAKTAAPLKKDGTPDMRHKVNKDAAAKTTTPAGPTKKDGTPDMRHKANKDAAAKPKK